SKVSTAHAPSADGLVAIIRRRRFSRGLGRVGHYAWRWSRYTQAMMRLSRDVAGPCLAPGGSVMAVGAFDGLHRGHQALLAQVRERAAALGCVPVVVSFEPLPRAFFSKEPLPRLSSVREKLQGFAAAGMEHALLLRFNTALTAMSAEDFVRRVLVERLAAREVWVGADFRFGHKRAGDVAMLERMGAESGFKACTMPSVLLDDSRVFGQSRAHAAGRRRVCRRRAPAWSPVRDRGQGGIRQPAGSNAGLSHRQHPLAPKGQPGAGHLRGARGPGRKRVQLARRGQSRRAPHGERGQRAAAGDAPVRFRRRPVWPTHGGGVRGQAARRAEIRQSGCTHGADGS
ncbi:bifunctional riboflavin kinase/FMN adenylyltransferase, partial [Rhodanobacter sp. 115]